MQAKSISAVFRGAILVGVIASAPVAQAVTGVLCIKETGKGNVALRNPICKPKEVQVGTFDTTASQASLATDVSFRATTPGAVSIPSAAPNIGSPVAFGAGSEEYDTASAHSEVTNPESFTAPVSGKYLIYAWVSMVANPNGTVRTVRIDGTSSILAATSGPVSATSFVNTQMNVSTHVDLTAGDVVTLRVSQDSGSALNTFATFGMVKIP